MVDNWELLFSDDIEGVFPKPECRVFDNNSDDGREYKWGDSSYRAQAGNWGAWAIRDGVASLGFIPSNQTNVPKITIDWHFGLYESDKTTPKPAQCVFAAYPEPGDCFETIYIPAMLKNY